MHNFTITNYHLSVICIPWFSNCTLIRKLWYTSVSLDFYNYSYIQTIILTLKNYLHMKMWGKLIVWNMLVHLVIYFASLDTVMIWNIYYINETNWGVAQSMHGYNVLFLRMKTCRVLRNLFHIEWKLMCTL